MLDYGIVYYCYRIEWFCTIKYLKGEGIRALGSEPWVLVLRTSIHFSKPKEIKVETFRIDYLIRTQKVEKLSLQPISFTLAPELKPPKPEI